MAAGEVWVLAAGAALALAAAMEALALAAPAAGPETLVDEAGLADTDAGLGGAAVGVAAWPPQADSSAAKASVWSSHIRLGFELDPPDNRTSTEVTDERTVHGCMA